ncbi:DUF6319 family protein [Nocardia camponoti]|uniref:Translation initiation factor n=1 Tax=Nocardia camponoti TaxID=1616106 RepID=A0A917QDI1_9NOCA|nr:DUF6319 family protein [Nocardia camponoti]GGK45160.1 hypothetical protein GCM10011591_15970 [Nocardia camponoti]
MSSPSTKPRRSAKPVLSDDDLAHLARELAEGRSPMVWFTAAAVGVAEGKSGKLLALGDPADGDFLQVRPTGSKDELWLGPSEITLIKPAKPVPAPAPKPAVKTVAGEPLPESVIRKEPPVTEPVAKPVSNGTPQPAPEAAKPAAPRPVKAPAARKTKTPEVTVTLSGTAEGEWTVDVVNGKKRSVRGVAVSSGAVAQAAQLLHPEVAEVVDGVLEAVRVAQQAKVEALQAELEAARQLLAELG